jgi:hypothetical protein
MTESNTNTIKKASFILDDVLEKKEFLEYQSYLQNVDLYQEVEADGNKKFYITNAPGGLEEKITTYLEKTWNAKVKVVLSGIRKATQYLDTDWAIHSDLCVGSEEIPEYGAVFYISQNESELNGTALWRHKEMGYRMPRNLSKDEVMRLSDRDYNDIDKWELSSVIGGIENRLVSYPAEYFHSKFPSKAWGVTQKDCRIVFVLFYSVALD